MRSREEIECEIERLEELAPLASGFTVQRDIYAQITALRWVLDDA